ncbi:MAG TPA: AAA family ATPase, partial [Candidatus Nanopelagicales bacterium]|nr:AAA family ATPase [Candidatus Nanopelagicales bacterium]
MRIERLSLKNVGPFDDAMLVFPEPEEPRAGELVLFEGPNGSGKSTLAEAIAVVAGPPRHPQGGGYEEETLTRGPYSKFIPRIRKDAQVEVLIRHEDASLICAARHANPWVQRTGSALVEELLDRFNNPSISGELRWSAFVLHAHMPSAQL